MKTQHFPAARKYLPYELGHNNTSKQAARGTRQLQLQQLHIRKLKFGFYFVALHCVSIAMAGNKS